MISSDWQSQIFEEKKKKEKEKKKVTQIWVQQA